MKMIIKVDKEELKNVSNDLLKSSDNISYEIGVWEKAIEKLKNIWQGQDADVFYSRIDSYLLKLKMLSETSTSIGKFIDRANNKYIEKDKEFASELKKENDQYEQREEHNNN